MIKSQTIIETAKQTVKKHQSSKNPMIRLGIGILSVLWNAIVGPIRFTDAEYRSVLYLRLFRTKNVHQTTPLTWMNRYPPIFATSSQYFEGKKDLKILSYGCSTGEEVLTLRQYFPTARIIGAEINQRSLAVCRKLPVDEKIIFIYSTRDEIQKYGPFDIIFCMAVLQRNPHQIATNGIRSLKKIYPFEKFEQQLIELDQLLNPQGLLVIHYTQYSLWDTSVASKYEALGDYYQENYEFPLFDKSSNLVATPVPLNSIFRKTSK